MRRLACGRLFLSWSGLLLLLASPAAHAAARPFRLGVEITAEISSFDHSLSGDSVRTTSRALPGFGISAERPLTGRCSGIVEVRYAPRGERRETRMNPFLAKEEVVREDFVAGALLLRGRVAGPVAVELGPELAYLVRARASGTYRSLSTGEVSYSDDYAGRTDRWDTLITGGPSIGWLLGGRPVTLRARYAYGLTVLDRPLHYLPPAQQPVAWTGAAPPGDPSRTRSFEILLAILW